MTGEFLYFFIYVAQQLGVMLGVGAQTVLLCAHLTALHHGEKESPHAHYARAAHMALGVGLVLIIVSGLVAIGVHFAGGQTNILLAPAFLFKWFLIALLLVAFFLYSAFFINNTYYALTGGTWYALFLVHSLGPVTSWITLWVLYIVWGVFFSCVWFCFAAVMKWRSRTLAAPAVEAPRPSFVAENPVEKSVPKPVQKIMPIVVRPITPPPAAPQPKPEPILATPPVMVPPTVTPAPTPVLAAVVSKPAMAVLPIEPVQPPVQIPSQITVVPKESWWRKLFGFSKKEAHPVLIQMPTTPVPPPAPPTPTPILTLEPLPLIKTAPKAAVPIPPPQKIFIPPPPATVPVLKPLSLAAHIAPPTTPTTILKKVDPVSTMVAAPPPAATASTGIVQDVIDHILVPALHIMPRTAEDIGKQRRPPVVK